MSPLKYLWNSVEFKVHLYFKGELLDQPLTVFIAGHMDTWRKIR